MADNLTEHLYPTGDDNGDIMAPPYAAQFENLYNLVNQLLLKVDGDQTKPLAPTKQHNIPSVPPDAASEGGSVDEYATHVYANSTEPAYIDPRDWIDLLPRAFNDILPSVNAYIPGRWTPRHDETDRFLTEEKRISSRDEYRHLACYGVYSAAADAALETVMATVRSTTATETERAHAWDITDAAVRTHKAVTQAVESRPTYVQRFKGKKALTGEERVAELLVYSRFFDTQAADRSTNGVDGLLAALEVKRIEVSFPAAAKAQAAQTFKQSTPGRVDGGNPERPTARPDKSLKDKELGDKEKREKREKDKTRQHKKPEPEAED
jgi:hypothetical protein